MTDKEYIIINREADIRSLALKKVPESVNALWCLQQIEGWQLARKKLPRWAAIDDIWYPPRLSMEQCSSELTAEYKQRIVRRLASTVPHCARFTDITGGFGVDFSYMAQGFEEAVYVEQQEQLCYAAQHNMPLLGLPGARIVNTDSVTFITHKAENTSSQPSGSTEIIYADPARRSAAGKKTVAIEDCTPDITTLQHTILYLATFSVIKLSPMLDITQALRSLQYVCEIHVVSVRGECKELLFVQSSKKEENAPIICHCVNLGTTDSPFRCIQSVNTPIPLLPADTDMTGMFLYEPNSSIMKAGVQDNFGVAYGLKKLHPMSHLYVADNAAPCNIPARRFRIIAVSDFSKSGIKALLGPERQANLTVRNFPTTVADLRKRLKLKEGGSEYLFATTLSNGKHAIIKCLQQLD